MDYLSANFSFHRPLCSQLRRDVRDRQIERQTDVRLASSLNISWAGHNNNEFVVDVQ